MNDKKKSDAMYALFNVSPGYPVRSVYARTESNGLRVEETPRNKSNLNPKITQRAKNKNPEERDTGTSNTCPEFLKLA